MRKKRRSVALLIETSNSYGRGLLQGVVAYLQEHRPWSIHFPEQGRGEAPPSWLQQWRGDGLIARVENAGIARAVQRTGLPVVDVSAARLIEGIPWVETDDRAIAAAGFAHLFERGFRNLAFCGEPAFNWSKWRQEQFLRLAADAGLCCRVYSQLPRRQRPTWDQEQQDLMQWVRRLPRPVGVMAAYDIKAQQLLDACRELRVDVPEDVAVIGVDNDELLCNLTEPPLSSVRPNTHRTGYEAAALLDRLMAGKTVPPVAHLIEPLGVVTRQSTDVLAIEDRDLAGAVRFIREHACEGIKVQEVLRAVPLSRRVLESRFRKLVGRTPHEEITRVQVERVKELLAETSLSLPAIAHRSGYRHVEYMSVAFKRETGQAPSQYRSRYRKDG
jgi:LacI family transcriptional regulator